MVEWDERVSSERMNEERTRNDFAESGSHPCSHGHFSFLPVYVKSEFLLVIMVGHWILFTFYSLNDRPLLVPDTSYPTPLGRPRTYSLGQPASSSAIYSPPSFENREVRLFVNYTFFVFMVCPLWSPFRPFLFFPLCHSLRSVTENFNLAPASGGKTVHAPRLWYHKLQTNLPQCIIRSQPNRIIFANGAVSYLNYPILRHPRSHSTPTSLLHQGRRSFAF